MRAKRLPIFLAVLALLLAGSFGLAHVMGWSNETICGPGEEPVRTLTSNKNRKFVCKKVEDRSNAEN